MKHQKLKGFTLVELMIAVALMVILTGSVVFVFTQAQEIYTRTDASVRVYQNARQAFDIMERDIANIYKTIDMEPWGPDKQDTDTKEFNGHLDQSGEGEGLVGTASGKLPPGQKMEDYRIVGTGSVSYFFSMAFESGTYKSPVAGLPDHFSDSMYFKTETPIDNSGKSTTTRTAQVRYGLSVHPQNLRAPILMKWILWLDKSKTTATVNAEMPQPLCYHVTDFRVELYIRNKRSNRPGKFYSVEDAIKLGNNGDMKTPLAGSQLFTPLFINHRGSLGLSGYSSTGEGRFNRVAAGEPYFTVAASSASTPSTGGNDSLFLYQLGKGDKLFLYQPEKEGNNYLIPQGEYTIKDIRFDNGQWKVYFREAIDTSQMDKANKNSTPIAYRGGWVPSAVRVTIKVVDEKSRATPQEVSRTIVRVFKILGS